MGPLGSRQELCVISEHDCFVSRAGVAKGLSMAIGVAAAAYGLYAGLTWLRYGQCSRASREDEDPLLDRFMPAYEVVERHHIRVAASAQTTFRAACETNLLASPISRAIFRAREVILGSTPDAT